MDQPTNTLSTQKALPNASTVLVLGILSIVSCFCYGVIGIILAIIAIVMANKDKALYNSNPDEYTLKSFSNLKTGRLCAIIGLVLSILFAIYMIFIISVIGFAALTSGDPQQIIDAMENLQ